MHDLNCSCPSLIIVVKMDKYGQHTKYKIDKITVESSGRLRQTSASLLNYDNCLLIITNVFPIVLLPLLALRRKWCNYLWKAVSQGIIVGWDRWQELRAGKWKACLKFLQVTVWIKMLRQLIFFNKGNAISINTLLFQFKSHEFSWYISFKITRLANINLREKKSDCKDTIKLSS